LEAPDEALSSLQHVLDKCLAKDREERYQTVKDLILDLKWVHRESGGEVAAPVTRVARTAGLKRWLLAGSLILLALTAGGLVYLLVPGEEKLPRLVNPTQVTSALGAEGYPTWSPEGGRLAYHLDQASDGRNFDIWVAQIGGGQPRQFHRGLPGDGPLSKLVSRRALDRLLVRSRRWSIFHHAGAGRGAPQARGTER
jgi:hypothetical protein